MLRMFVCIIDYGLQLWSSMLGDRMSVGELVPTSGVTIIVGMWGSESVMFLSLRK